MKQCCYSWIVVIFFARDLLTKAWNGSLRSLSEETQAFSFLVAAGITWYDRSLSAAVCHKNNRLYSQRSPLNHVVFSGKNNCLVTVCTVSTEPGERKAFHKNGGSKGQCIKAMFPLCFRRHVGLGRNLFPFNRYVTICPATRTPSFWTRVHTHCH